VHSGPVRCRFSPLSLETLAVLERRRRTWLPVPQGGRAGSHLTGHLHIAKAPP
jgi:hypothetical protein